VSAVLQVVSTTARRGAEVFATDLAAALGPSRPVETVALAAADGHGPVLDLPVLGEGRPRSPATLQALRARLVPGRLVVAHGSDTLVACAVATARHRDGFVYRSIGDPAYWSGGAWRRRRVSALLRRARAVVTLWEGARRLLVDRYRVPAALVRVIPNGVPAARFPLVDGPRRAHARQRLGYCEGDAVVAYLGALSPEKDVGLAVAAVGRLPGTHLLVAGAGPERDALMEQGERQAPGRVRFLGAVEDTAAVLAAADAVVLPSRTEGMPAVLIEAGLSGLPVVATDVGAVGQVVEARRTGLLVPPGDAGALVGALATALELPRGWASEARHRCLERYEIGVVAAQWAALLDELRDAAP
jgi:glycosyltransferase involved in cell wall biosynthesis